MKTQLFSSFAEQDYYNEPLFHYLSLEIPNQTYPS